MSDHDSNFDDTLATLLSSARKWDELTGMLQGLEFADERGWLDDTEKTKLTDGQHGEKIEREAFARAHQTLASAWPNEWRTWLEALRQSMAILPDAPSHAAAMETLRAEAAKEKYQSSLSWAICVGDRLRRSER